MTIDIEKVILRNLQYNADFARKVLPYINENYFSTTTEQTYFSRLVEYFDKYNALPSKDALDIDIQSLQISQDVFDGLAEQIKFSHDTKDTPTNQDWLLAVTEKFCKDRALFLALTECVNIAEGKGQDKSLSTTAIPDILTKALGVTFDTNVGHDYLLDTDARFEYNNRKTSKIPFPYDIFNTITGGGAELKTVNVIGASTGVGKSMMMCDLAAHYIRTGYNVLYITLEMSEFKISQRIDANLMNVPLADAISMPRPLWDQKVEQIRAKCTGRLKVKEFPTGAAHVGHFRATLKELAQKNGFAPTIIFVDYMNICASAKFKDRSNSYGYVKSIAEELRGFAVEQNIMLWTATQLNRDGINNSDADLKNISESMGGPHTFDFLFAIITNEELAQLNQVLVKQLKSRYGDINHNSKFNLGIDRPKMKFYDLQNTSPQRTTVAPTQNSKPTNQQGNFGLGMNSKPSNLKFKGDIKV